MKTKHLSTGLGLALLAAGCATTYPAYEGPRLPADQVAIIEVPHP